MEYIIPLGPSNTIYIGRGIRASVAISIFDGRVKDHGVGTGELPSSPGELVLTRKNRQKRDINKDFYFEIPR